MVHEKIVSGGLRKWVLLCHDRHYVQYLKKACEWLKEGEVIRIRTGDVNICRHSYTAAIDAVAAGIAAVDEVMTGAFKRAFVVTRPPGHHAGRSYGMGFCLFNTVAIAARYAQKKYGVKRILIVDWDVHHGNGTQEIFYEDPSVWYFSTHEEGNYPRTGKLEEIGMKRGTGTTINRPIAPGKHSREELLRYYMEELPIIFQESQPELVFISCGFDTHKDDPLSSFSLETEDFTTLTAIVRSLAEIWSQGRLISILEGGYQRQALMDSAVAHMRALSLS
jgi:acetoin utilization deacetylase AcuC-like enzyme